MQASKTPQDASPTVYFDGDCLVCSREIAMYRRQPGADAVCWVNAAACDAGAFGPGLSRDAALARLHVRRADGTLVGGAAAFIAMWAALPRTAMLARWLNHRPVVALLDAAYGAFLLLRRAWRRAP
ncbi:DCC1-like thiol-disulfide oxidoreductase family protein [Roseateles sp.]|uniref:DCC1-like thiol-disulfide oxidoreductase family protein n=1 Tax=Roseateles sp. TaxID=1971397 RepID=UPI004036E502